MTDPRIPLKNPWLAAFLAYMLPGAGHLYQGRFIKGAIYGVCILGMFVYGLVLSDGTALHLYQVKELPGGQVAEQRNWGFLAQMGIGTPAAWTLLQSIRFQSASNAPTSELTEPLRSEFEGALRTFDGGERVSGRIELKPIRTEFGPDAAGTFVGTARGEDGTKRQVELELRGGVQLGRPIAGSREWPLVIQVIGQQDGREAPIGRLEGSIRRSLASRLGAPVPDRRLQEMHGKFGKIFELALIYTWIAGLLNILAVWDAFEGPAYGYGDDEPAGEADPNDLQRSAKGAATDEKQPAVTQRRIAAAESAHHPASAD
jgi:hypothetical protein